MGASEVYIEAIEAAKRAGCPVPLEGLFTMDVPAVSPGSTWRITVNGTRETVDHAPPFHLVVLWNGWPAGIVGPGEGIIAAGELANEDTLIEALQAFRVED